MTNSVLVAVEAGVSGSVSDAKAPAHPRDIWLDGVFGYT
jgi:hypothetical protein